MENDKLVSRIIANTRRQKRALNLVEIAEDVKKLNDGLGSTKDLAQIVLLSQSMIGQFLSILSLSPSVKDLVRSRKIDSVSSCFYISKFEPEDQELLADLLINNDINSSELRLILPLRKRHKSLSVPELIKKLQDSQDKKVSVIQFEAEASTLSISEIEIRLLKAINKSDIISVEISGKIGVIRLTPSGEKQLRQSAKKAKKSLQDYIYTILY